jgi:hypothetical protein
MVRTLPSENWWRTRCKFGLKRRFVLMLEWLTKLPTCGFLPQKIHCLLIMPSIRETRTGKAAYPTPAKNARRSRHNFPAREQARLLSGIGLSVAGAQFPRGGEEETILHAY